MNRPTILSRATRSTFSLRGAIKLILILLAIHLFASLSACAYGPQADLQRLQNAYDAGFYPVNPSNPAFVKQYYESREFYHELYRRPNLLWPYIRN